MKVCLITGSRAEYGMLKQLIFLIKKEKTINIKIVVTGAHLSKKYGKTIKEIKSDGIKVSKRVNLNIKSRTSEDIIKSINKGMLGFVKVFKNLSPEIIIVLGDRYEIFSAVVAACFCKIPIAHIHGGETTHGAIDEALRHTITKMSHFHFVANSNYKKRVIQLGENPNKVFVVGGLGVDSIKKTKLLTKHQLEKKIGLKFKKKNLIVNFHPETLNNLSIKIEFSKLLNVLKKQKDTNLIFTMPNSDQGSELISKMIKNFVKKNNNTFFFSSLGSLNFYSCLQYVDGMIGNSSSGLLEMPTFKKGTINIGKRQDGRLKAKSVINSKLSKQDILKSINILYSKSFQNKLRTTTNPYGNGGASLKILNILKKIKLKNILIKKFYDI